MDTKTLIEQTILVQAQELAEEIRDEIAALRTHEAWARAWAMPEPWQRYAVFKILAEFFTPNGVCAACGESAYGVPPHDVDRCCLHCGRYSVLGADVIASLEHE